MSTIYLFSGLGADERAFQELDFGGVSTVHIPWLIPHQKESLREYAERLAKQLKEDDPILIGLSFGGMVAVEVAKLIKPKKLILIASAKSKHEIPFYFRWIGKIRIHWLIPTRWLKRTSGLTMWFFGAKTPGHKRLLEDILHDTDPIFLRWAINTIVSWNNEIIPDNVIHIHGSGDRILPIKFIRPDIIIPNGGHLMTLDRAVEITAAIRGLLKRAENRIDKGIKP